MRFNAMVTIGSFEGEEKRTIGAGQAKIIKLTITLNNFITLEDQLIPSI